MNERIQMAKESYKEVKKDLAQDPENSKILKDLTKNFKEN